MPRFFPISTITTKPLDTMLSSMITEIGEIETGETVMSDATERFAETVLSDGTATIAEIEMSDAADKLKA